MARAAWLLSLLLAWFFAAAGTARAQAVLSLAPADQQPAILALVDEPAAVNILDLFSAAPTAAPAGAFKADLDFLFLQPIFPVRAVRLQVPAPGGGTALGDSSNLSNDFAFSPGFQLGYQFASAGLGIQATGRILHLTGKLERTVHDSQRGILGEVTASSTVDVAVTNPLEGFVVVATKDWFTCVHPYLNETQFTITVGSRYVHLQQNYSTTVVTGPGYQGSLVGRQTFDGFGVTSSVIGRYPLAERLAGYSTMRGSLVLGENDRESTITIVAPGANVASKARELITNLFPVGELEAGLMYGKPLARRGPPPDSAPLLWMKGGFVSQIWGNLGLLNINETGGNQFSGSNLVLVGFTVQIGLDY